MNFVNKTYSETSIYIIRGISNQNPIILKTSLSNSITSFLIFENYRDPVSIPRWDTIRSFNKISECS